MIQAENKSKLLNCKLGTLGYFIHILNLLSEINHTSIIWEAQRGVLRQTPTTRVIKETIMTKTVITLSITVSHGGICFPITLFWLDALIKRDQMSVFQSYYAPEQRRTYDWISFKVSLESLSTHATIRLNLQSWTTMNPYFLVRNICSKRKDSGLCLGSIYCLFLSFPGFIPLMLYNLLASAAKSTIALSGSVSVWEMLSHFL